MKNLITLSYLLLISYLTDRKIASQRTVSALPIDCLPAPAITPTHGEKVASGVRQVIRQEALYRSLGQAWLEHTTGASEIGRHI